MSTKDFLDGLSYDQLVFARDEAARRIKVLNESTKVKLWVVSDDGINYAAFHSEEYGAAAQRMAGEIVKYAKRHPGSEFSFSLRKLAFHENEVQDMIDLGK